MGCGSCGNNKNNGSLPTGCKDHGSCRSGGCNRLNVHDWLSLIPVADFSRPFPFVEVSFNHGSRKEFFKAQNPDLLEKGDFVTVESNLGFDVGIISLTGELVKLQMKKKGVKEKSDEIKKILHISTPNEIARQEENKRGEKEKMIRARVIARELKLEMKIAEVEVQADGKKATFFYTADDRVDFRELIRRFAESFKVKVEMRQIGIRQEAGKVGGIGSCGRELCCSTWLNDFKSVSTTAARYQNLSINQTKLSGQCGRLKCCLNYELDTYMDALRVFPNNVDRIKTKTGTAYLQKKDIFKNLMWYSYEKSNTLYPLTIERVKEINEFNKQGIFPDDLQAVEVTKKTIASEKTDFVDVVGQFSLKGLERASKKKKEKAKVAGQNQQSKPTGNKPQTPNTKPHNPNQGGQKPNQKPQANNNNQKNKPGTAVQGGNKPRPATSAQEKPATPKPQQKRPPQQKKQPQTATPPPKKEGE